MRILDGLIPVRRRGNAVQGERDVPRNQPGDDAARHDPDRPSYTRNGEDTSIESQQRQLDKDSSGRIEEILDEEIQYDVAHDCSVFCWNGLVVNAETNMDPDQFIDEEGSHG